jgi:Phage gp6-like head-tail connector protein
MTPFLGQVQNLLEITPPVEEPITLAQAKLHLRVDVADDDALITALITAAREKCEAEVHRSFVTRSYELHLNGFPFSNAPTISQLLTSERIPCLSYGRIKVPKPPLILITSITYLDNDGVPQTIDPALYLVQLGGKLQGMITPAYGLTWPVARYQLGCVVVAYTAGYGAASSVPLSICQAMLLCIGHWYRNREAVSAVSMSEVPLGAKALLSPFHWGSYG